MAREIEVKSVLNKKKKETIGFWMILPLIHTAVVPLTAYIVIFEEVNMV